MQCVCSKKFIPETPEFQKAHFYKWNYCLKLVFFEKNNIQTVVMHQCEENVQYNRFIPILNPTTMHDLGILVYSMYS